MEKPLTVTGTVSFQQRPGQCGWSDWQVSEKITIRLDSYKGNASIATVHNSGYAGGLVGDITSTFVLESVKGKESAPSITIKGNIQYGTGVGGFAGRVEGVDFEIPAVTVDATLANGTHVGGVVGYVNNSKLLLKDPTVAQNSQLTGTTATGGMIGTIANGSKPSAVALDGTVTVAAAALREEAMEPS